MTGYRLKKKNTEGFCIIQVDDNGFCKPVTHNHKGSMYLFTSMQFIMGIYIFFLVTNEKIVGKFFGRVTNSGNSYMPIMNCIDVNK